MHIELGLYPCFLVAINTKIRECLGAQTFNHYGIYVSVDKITQKVAVHLPENQSVLIIQSSDLSHVFDCDLEQNQTGVMMKGKNSTLSSVFLRHYKNTFFDDV